MAAVRIVPFRGFGTTASFALAGRVLRGKPPPPEVADASAWNNFLAAFRQLESDELAGVHVRARYEGELWEAVTDAEGYFECSLRPRHPRVTTEVWHAVQLACEVPGGGDDAVVEATGQVMMPPLGCRYGVISDIDDTLLWSYATAPLRAALELLLKNASTREAVAGAPAFYRALHAGVGGEEGNPFFYVSLSPWNLYELLVAFLQRHRFPDGPLLLRDLGVESLYAFGQAGLKQPPIRRILETYPALPFLLLGDSGQHDPETYLEIVREWPGRVLAVYIRDVKGGERRAEVEAVGVAIRWEGVPFVLSAETADFWVDAAGRNLAPAAA